MNFLAHAHLSFGHPQILVGNMISDFVKGKAQYDYDPAIRKGITLHRQIDSFTDEHAATKEAKKIFSADYRLYSGAVMDVIYDHFLANDNTAFAEGELLSFTEEVYATLEEYSAHLPPRFVAMLPYMKAENWLYNYKFREGTERSLRGLVRRATYLTDHETAFRLFNQHYATLQHCYDAFFPDVKNYTKDQLNRLL